MDPTRKRTLLRVGVVLVAGLAVLFWALSHREPGFVIENHSGQRITHLRLTIADHTREFENIAVGGQVTGERPPGGDGRWRMEGELADGVSIRASGNSGATFHFLILPGGTVQIRFGKERGS